MIKSILQKSTSKKTKVTTRYKFLHDGLTSEHGNFTWKLGAWQKIKGDLKICSNGFHCSKNLGQAFSYVQGEIVAEVEVRGKNEVQDNKEAWEEMRVVRAWKWQQKNSVEMAIFAAEQVIEIFEKDVPTDDRPRKAIEAAKAYLADPSKENKDAARAAADAARAAARAARAAYAADAADAAAHAAHAAAHAAHAADAARAARAARAAMLKKIYARFQEQSTKLEPYN